MKKKCKEIMLSAMAILLAANVNAQTKMITTICGNGTAAYGGDGASATAAKLNAPTGVAVDDSGRIYIADKANARIRRISKTGIISTYACNGTSGYSGDNGQATAAKISPAAIAADHAGNIFVADAGNNCVRKITRTGIITTIAGNTTSGFMGDNGPATAAQLASPAAVAVDTAGNVYIADETNNRIRKVSTTGIITTVAGGGASGMGDGGPATAGTLNIPVGIAVNKAGTLFIADQGNNVIRTVSAGGTIFTFAGTGASGYSGDGGPAMSAKFNYPNGVSTDDSGNVYVVEGNTSVVRKINAIGTISTIAGTGGAGFAGDGGPATAGKISNPAAVAIDTSGTIYIADLGNNRVRRVGLVSHVGIPGINAGSTNIALMPNPNNGLLTVKASFDAISEGNMLMCVTDITGRQVYSSTAAIVAGSLTTQISLNNVPSGTYFLHLSSGSYQHTFSFAVQR